MEGMCVGYASTVRTAVPSALDRNFHVDGDRVLGEV